MTRNDFFRTSGRWLMLLLLLAAGGFMLASSRITLRNHCTLDPDCGGCGLRTVCKPAEKTKLKSDEKEEKI